MLISVIIPTFRRGESLVILLRDLKGVYYANFEIVVVDQTPEDEYCHQVYRELKDLAESGLFRWIYYPRNFVYEARNYGAAVSTGDFLLWLDDDVRVGPDLFSRFAKCIRENPDISIIQGGFAAENIFNDISLENPYLDLQEKIDQATIKTNDKKPDIQGKKSKLLKLKPELQAFYCENAFKQPTKECTWISANNMMVKRSTFDMLCGWDEYILNYGDRNLGIRAAKAGFKIHWYPYAAIVHLQAMSGGSRMSDPNNPIKGWKACVSTWYLAFRYLKYHPIAFCKFGIFKSARYSFLLRKNFFPLNNLIYGLVSYVLAAFIGFFWSFLKPISSYPMWRKQFLEGGGGNLPAPHPVKRVPQ